MRRMVPRLAMPVLVVSLLSACGINSGPVISDHVAEKADAGQVSGSGGPPLRRNLHINDPVDLVMAFLRAPAGDPAGEGNVVRSYMADGDSWTPRPGLKVVRVLERPEPTDTIDGFTVNLRVQHVGVLNDSGQLTPSTEGFKTYEYKVVSDQDGYILRDSPKDLLLSEAGLADLYVERPLYFWSGDVMLADPRYVFNALSIEAQSNSLVEWLYDGPSNWLDNAVDKLPSETEPGVTQVVRGEKGTLVIDLTTAGQEFQKLAEQLAQTLVVSPLTGLEIKVRGEPKIASQGTRDDRVDYRARRYAVVDNRVRRLTASGVDTEELLPAEENKNLVSVAFAKDERAVAVVQQEGSLQRLKIGSRSGLQPVALPAVSSIAQPIWLDGGTQLLVLADQVIYQVGPDGKAEPKQAISGLTSMSVAADGRGLALVVNGALHLTSRRGDGSINFGPLKSYLLPTMFSSVQGAVFGGKGELIVAGTGTDDGLRRLIRMNINGTRQIELNNQWHQGLTIRGLVADPYTGNAMFELQGEAYEVRQSGSVRLAEVMTLPSPSPTGKPKVIAPSFEGWL